MVQMSTSITGMVGTCSTSGYAICTVMSRLPSDSRKQYGEGVLLTMTTQKGMP